MLDAKLCSLIKNASWTKDSLGQLFEKFDTDKSGRISSSEFKRAFEGLGLSASQYDVEQLVRRIDKGESWRVWHFAIAIVSYQSYHSHHSYPS